MLVVGREEASQVAVRAWEGLASVMEMVRKVGFGAYAAATAEAMEAVATSPWAGLVVVAAVVVAMGLVGEGKAVEERVLAAQREAQLGTVAIAVEEEQKAMEEVRD